MPFTPLDRRTFLRSSGVAMSLPLLQSMLPTSSKARESSTPDIRRMMAFCAPLGIHTPHFFPKETGKDYVAPMYLEPLQPIRDKFSVISGLMHPRVDGGHAAEKSFLTGAAHPGLPSFRNTISFDQVAAKEMGHLTRHPSLVLSVSSRGLSYTQSGVAIPAETISSKLYNKLFLEGRPSEKAEQLRRIKAGQSVMDLVSDQVKSIGRKIGREDNETLDQYFTSVREVEKSLVNSENWARHPKPLINDEPPEDVNDRAYFSKRLKNFLDLSVLALQTDSSRLITLSSYGGNLVIKMQGVHEGWHNLSHHGKDPRKLKQLTVLEMEEMRLFADFLKTLESIKEGENTLLDQTSVVMGSNMGNASSHNNTNLPILAAGGHFQHGQHLAYDPKSPPPLCNLFVSIMQQHLQLGIDEFSTGKGTLTELKPWS